MYSPLHIITQFARNGGCNEEVIKNFINELQDIKDIAIKFGNTGNDIILKLENLGLDLTEGRK